VITAAELLADLDHGSGSTLLVPPDPGPGAWVGGPSAVTTPDGVVLAYRLRRPVGAGRGFANVVAIAPDGLALRTVATIRREDHDCDSLERPCLLPDPAGGWRLYLSCATPGSKHWRVDLLRADTLAALPSARPLTVLPGDPERVAVKDPVIRIIDGVWHLWASCHPLDDPDATDRMTVDHAVSADGLDWRWTGTVLSGTPGAWDARGVRPAAVLDVAGGLLMIYDGRASAGENWEERTGAAIAASPDGQFRSLGAAPAFVSLHGSGGLRYLTASADPATGRLRVYYESARADGSHELRTQLLSR
jgi:hypothetical protein